MPGGDGDLAVDLVEVALEVAPPRSRRLHHLRQAADLRSQRLDLSVDPGQSVEQQGSPLARIAREVPASVEPDATLRDVANAASKYNLLSVPVVDRAGVLLGMVTVDDILSEVLHER